MNDDRKAKLIADLIVIGAALLILLWVGYNQVKSTLRFAPAQVIRQNDYIP